MWRWILFYLTRLDSIFVQGTLLFLATSVLWVAGVIAGHAWRLDSGATDLPIDALTRWDAQRYARIADSGYEFDPNHSSTVTFFPAFPLLGWALAFVTNLDTRVGLLVVSQVCLWAALVAFVALCRSRRNDSQRARLFSCLALGVWPTSCFFHFAYSESLFLLLVVSSLLGMARNWSRLVLALLIGSAAAARPVGIVLLLPFMLHLWRESREGVGNRLADLVCFGALASWGLAAYMSFLHGAFGDPFSFATSQIHIRFRTGDTLEKLICLGTLEPFRAVFDEHSPCFWRRFPSTDSIWFNLHAANLVFVGAILMLLILGYRNNWITADELVLGLALVAIPYFTRGFEMCLAGMGRFTAVIVPGLIAAGRLLESLPLTIATLLLGLGAAYLVIFSALFAAGFAVY